MTIKLAPAVRFPGFTDVWEQRNILEISKVFIGLVTTMTENYRNEGTLLIRNSDIKENRFEFSDNPIHLDEAFAENNSSRRLIIGDVITIHTGDIGTSAVIGEREDGAIGFATINTRPNQDVLDSNYLSTYFNTEKHKNYAIKVSTGDGRSNYNLKDFNRLSVPLPLLDEQKKIGFFFKQLNDTIALHQRELDNLKITKQVFMKKMFPKEGEKVPEVRFPGFMADWDYRKLGDVGETYTGLSGKSKDDFGHGRGKYVTYMNVFSNSIANPSLVELVEIDTKQNEVNPGDIFFTTSSETPEEVGMSSVWLENSDNTYLNSFCFGYRPIEKFDNYYLAYMLRSSVVRKKITFLAQGISRYNISKNKVMDIAVPIPVIEEQTKIGEFFKQLDDIINLQQQELEKLKQTKQAFLQKMFI